MVSEPAEVRTPWGTDRQSSLFVLVLARLRGRGGGVGTEHKTLATLGQAHPHNFQLCLSLAPPCPLRESVRLRGCVCVVSIVPLPHEHLRGVPMCPECPDLLPTSGHTQAMPSAHGSPSPSQSEACLCASQPHICLSDSPSRVHVCSLWVDACVVRMCPQALTHVFVHFEYTCWCTPFFLSPLPMRTPPPPAPEPPLPEGLSIVLSAPCPSPLTAQPRPLRSLSAHPLLSAPSSKDPDPEKGQMLSPECLPWSDPGPCTRERSSLPRPHLSEDICNFVGGFTWRSDGRLGTPISSLMVSAITAPI